MSRPREADDVKLVSSLFTPQKQLIEQAVARMEEIYGPVDWISPELYFDRTRYYEREMSWPLHRRFVSFESLVRPEYLAHIKLTTNELERLYLKDENRLVNIDPGYVSLERLVLATGKNYIHRIYIGSGIYADLTLVFKRGSFAPLEWTYKDYADPVVIELFNGIRERYKKQLRSL